MPATYRRHVSRTELQIAEPPSMPLNPFRPHSSLLFNRLIPGMVSVHGVCLAFTLGGGHTWRVDGLDARCTYTFSWQCVAIWEFPMHLLDTISYQNSLFSLRHAQQPGRKGPSDPRAVCPSAPAPCTADYGPRAAAYYAEMQYYQPGHTATAGPSQYHRGSNLDGFSLNSNPIPPPSNLFVCQNTDFRRGIMRYQLGCGRRVLPLPIIFVHLLPQLLQEDEDVPGGIEFPLCIALLNLGESAAIPLKLVPTRRRRTCSSLPSNAVVDKPQILCPAKVDGCADRKSKRPAARKHVEMRQVIGTPQPSGIVVDGNVADREQVMSIEHPDRAVQIFPIRRFCVEWFKEEEVCLGMRQTTLPLAVGRKRCRGRGVGEAIVSFRER